MSELQKQMIEFSTMDLVSFVAASRKLAPAQAMSVVYKSPFLRSYRIQKRDSIGNPRIIS